MRLYLLPIFLIINVNFLYSQKTDAEMKKTSYVMVIHGGAGTILKKNMTPETEKAYIEKLEEALKAGYQAIENGKTSLEAVQKAINIMEDSPLFNAGRGSVFTNDEAIEMDASVMEGKNRNAGAIAGVSNIKNPINAAIAVLEKSEHVLLTGRGAEEFAKRNQVELVDPSWLHNPQRLEQLRRIKDTEKMQLDHDNGKGSIDPSENEFNFDADKKFGTVGAVALDKEGNLAAGTSTGGMTNKRFGRVGDSPIIGAGTYADNNTCGVSSTGHGEYFIRGLIAYEVAVLMEHRGLSLEEAAHKAIHKKLETLGGKGGIIAMDAQGNVSMPFNTEGMYRGTVDKKGNVEILIYK
jgi:L-asparaginase / beta-aspartyl-peptidase